MCISPKLKYEMHVHYCKMQEITRFNAMPHFRFLHTNCLLFTLAQYHTVTTVTPDKTINATQSNSGQLTQLRATQASSRN